VKRRLLLLLRGAAVPLASVRLLIRLQAGIWLHLRPVAQQPHAAAVCVSALFSAAEECVASGEQQQHVCRGSSPMCFF
jgi:hypothetical protein